MKEFYFRLDNDPLFVPGVFEVSSEIEALLYQIKLVLNTRKGDVLGADTFGANIDDLLFSFDFNDAMLNSVLVEQVNNYCEMARSYKLDFNVRKFQDEKYRDLGVIDVAINGKSVMGFLY
jgi:hypothetical protein